MTRKSRSNRTKQSRSLKIFSFFSGSGFLDLGFEVENYRVELVNENYPSFMNAYRYSRKQMGLPVPTFGYAMMDINEYLSVKEEELRTQAFLARSDGSLVGFVGGPPCPDFSIAGKQRGRNGDNGKLSQSYVDIICVQRPDFFLFENVKGLWKTAKHRAFFEDLKEELRGVGYLMTERLTNALEFGAPQDRDRILLFGVQKELAKSLGDPVRMLKWERYAKYDLAKLKSLSWPTTSPFVKDVQTECPENIPIELTVQYWFDRNDVNNHPNAEDCFVPHSGLSKMQTIDEGDDSKKSYKRIHRWRYSPTVAYGNNEVHLHPYKERRLTVAEALSLQSLPKEFVLPPEMSLTDKFKTIGNGVPFLLANGIARTIRDYFEGK